VRTHHVVVLNVSVEDPLEVPFLLSVVVASWNLCLPRRSLDRWSDSHKRAPTRIMEFNCGVTQELKDP
jgi:hypothetical protein